MSTWNKKNFSIYTSDERSALGLIEELGNQTNYNTEEIEKVKESDNKKVSHDEMNRIYKIDKNANFTGSWHGIKKPTASQEGLQATVDKIVEQDIPNIINKTTNIYYLSEYVKNINENNDENIKKMVNKINANPNNVKVIFNIPKLIISKPFYIHRGNIEIDFNNCNIIWENYNSVGDDSGINRNVGIFNFRGTETSGAIPIEYCSYLSPILFDKFTANTTINEGDYLYLQLGDNTGLGDSNDPINPYIERLVKVIKIMGDDIQINYRNSWRELINRLQYRQTVKKVAPLRNIIIRNFNYKDITNLPAATEDYNSKYSKRNKNNLVCGLYFIYCADVWIYSAYGEEITFPVIEFMNCCDIHIDDVKAIRPRLIGPGEGYGVQLMNVHNFEVNNCTGEQERHVFDVTNGSNGNVRKCYSYNTRGYGISQHGAYEHDIVYEDCIAQFQTGNSGATFGNACKNITYVRCAGRLMGQYAENLTVDSCEFECNTYGTINSKFINSKIVVRPWDGVKTIKPNQKRGKNNTAIFFYNCKVDEDISQYIQYWDNIYSEGTPLKIDIKPLNGWIKKENTKNEITVNGNVITINFSLKNGTATSGTKLFTLHNLFRPEWGHDISFNIMAKTSTGTRVIAEGYICKSDVALYRSDVDGNISEISGSVSFSRYNL